MLSLGVGTFGQVFSALSKTGGAVALKKIKVDPRMINRELDILQKIDSPYCLKLIDHYTTIDEETGCEYLWIVTDIMPGSLKKHLDYLHMMKEKMDPLLMKKLIYQMFAGLAHLHDLGITHRDIKTDNLLVDIGKEKLEICDFGTAKIIQKGEASVSYIASRYYRAPELLLGCKYYGHEIDIWAAGCVICEILQDSLPMFEGDSNEDQLVQIMRILGEPTDIEKESFDHEKEWPHVERISNLEHSLPLSIDRNLLDLIKRIFVFDPAMRPTAHECLKSPYFDGIEM